MQPPPAMRVAPASRCAASAKFSTSLAVWKPMRSAEMRSLIKAPASGTLASMSGEGNGMCKKKPIGAVIPRARSIAGIAIR